MIRTYSIEFQRQVAQEYLAGETLPGLAKRHDICRESGSRNMRRARSDEDAQTADLLQQHEALNTALECLVGKEALELEFPRGL